MKNLLADRIKEIIDAGYTQADLCRASGVSRGTPNQWLDGQIKSIKLEYALGIQEATGYNAVWIVSGKGSKKTDAANKDNDDSKIIKIQRVSLKLSAGITGFSVDAEHDPVGTYNIEKSWLESRGLFKDNLIAIRVKGDSMAPKLHHGDTVVIDTADTKPEDGTVFAVNYEGEAVVKRLSRDAGEWWLVSDNPDQAKYHRKLCRSGDCIIIGRIVRKESDII